jgi:hypothetical protein
LNRNTSKLVFLDARAIYKFATTLTTNTPTVKIEIAVAGCIDASFLFPGKVATEAIVTVSLLARLPSPRLVALSLVSEGYSIRVRESRSNSKYALDLGQIPFSLLRAVPFRLNLDASVTLELTAYLCW